MTDYARAYKLLADADRHITTAEELQGRIIGLRWWEIFERRRLEREFDYHLMMGKAYNKAAGKCYGLA